MDRDLSASEDYLVIKSDDGIHIVPTYSSQKHMLHTLNFRCWCQPQLDHEDEQTHMKCFVHYCIQ